MRNYIFYFFTCAQLICAHALISCPYYFSPDDKRPFFEQYDIATPDQPEKEEKS